MADVQVQDEGSIIIFNLLTDSAQEWVDENVGGEYQFFGKNGLVVEPRYANGLAEGMEQDGLEVIADRTPARSPKTRTDSQNLQKPQ